MGWGINIPALGINTGEFIGGDVGKVLTNISREADTPLGRTLLMGPVFGAAKAIENQQKSMSNVQKPSTDFGPLTSKWNQLQEDISTTMPQQAIGDLQSQSQVGVQAGMGALGQKGGQGIGAASRLQTQSKWDVAQGAADINQGAQEMGTQFAMNKIKGVDIPVIQGQQLSQAQQQAALAKSKAATGGQLGGLVGAGLGSFFGPTGAMIGYQMGSGVGQSAWG